MYSGLCWSLTNNLSSFPADVPPGAGLSFSAGFLRPRSVSSPTNNDHHCSRFSAGFSFPFLHKPTINRNPEMKPRCLRVLQTKKRPSSYPCIMSVKYKQADACSRLCWLLNKNRQYPVLQFLSGVFISFLHKPTINRNPEMKPRCLRVLQTKKRPSSYPCIMSVKYKQADACSRLCWLLNKNRQYPVLQFLSGVFISFLHKPTINRNPEMKPRCLRVLQTKKRPSSYPCIMSVKYKHADE